MMGTPLRQALDKLRDNYNILPFSSAVEFCYVNIEKFKFTPFYKRYFQPFFPYKNNTFFYINDFNQYSLEMLEDDERQKALSIIYVIVVGITDDIAIELSNKTAMQNLLTTEPRFQMNVFPMEEFYELGIKFNESYGYTFPIAFEEAMNAYDIPRQSDKKVAIFGMELTR